MVNTMHPVRTASKPRQQSRVQTRISAMNVSSTRAYRNHGVSTASHNHRMALQRIDSCCHVQQRKASSSAAAAAGETTSIHSLSQK